MRHPYRLALLLTFDVLFGALIAWGFYNAFDAPVWVAVLAGWFFGLTIGTGLVGTVSQYIVDKSAT